MTITTRVAKHGDAAAVETLLKATYPKLMAGAYEAAVLAPALELITKANPLLLASGTYYVAESRDGAVIGCGGWTLDQPPGTSETAARAGHLRHFATHPEWARRGVGRAIYRQCEAAARSAGVDTLDVFSSLNGEAFYAALGFARVRAISVRLTPTLAFPSVLMRRAI